MFGEILTSPLKPVTICGKSSISNVWQGFELIIFAEVLAISLINLIKIPPSIKKYSIVHSQNDVTLCSSCLLHNENYNTCFLTICFYRPIESTNAIFNINHIYTFFLHLLIPPSPSLKMVIQGNNLHIFLWNLKIWILKKTFFEILKSLNLVCLKNYA